MKGRGRRARSRPPGEVIVSEAGDVERRVLLRRVGVYAVPSSSTKRVWSRAIWPPAKSRAARFRRSGSWADRRAEYRCPAAGLHPDFCSGRMPRARRRRWAGSCPGRRTVPYPSATATRCGRSRSRSACARGGTNDDLPVCGCEAPWGARRCCHGESWSDRLHHRRTMPSSFSCRGRPTSSSGRPLGRVASLASTLCSRTSSSGPSKSEDPPPCALMWTPVVGPELPGRNVARFAAAGAERPVALYPASRPRVLGHDLTGAPRRRSSTPWGRPRGRRAAWRRPSLGRARLGSLSPGARATSFHGPGGSRTRRGSVA